MTDNQQKQTHSPLNQIFYGPSGTGKTYHTVHVALDIICPDYLSNNQNDRKKLKARFDQLLAEQRIGFVTFHQSFSYEDFVEGLKPTSNEEGALQYHIEEGLFKKMSGLAASRVEKENVSHHSSVVNRRIWKMSLGNTLANDAYVYDECIDNDYVLLGYGRDLDFSRCKNRAAILATYQKAGYQVKKGSYEITAVDTFVNKMNVGDLIIVSDGNTKYRAIAEIVGAYRRLNDDQRTGYFQSRAVRWLKTFKPSRPREEIFKKAISQMTLYKLRQSTLNIENLRNILTPKPTNDARKLPYVLIIDEINRGNTASIFGELITLIEPSKREGAVEALSLKLPYSKESFSVPDNLYLIGTMNTADRSLALMDTALRRRFHFVEMMPDYSLLADIDIEGIQIDQMLKVMNQRITVLYDREHTLGHSFFLPLKDDASMALLQRIFAHKILPLLQEYFFEDWSKIQLILADDQKKEAKFRMITETNDIENLFQHSDELSLSLATIFQINVAALSCPESYIGIYQTAT